MSMRGRLRVAAWTLFGTLGCITVSVTYNWLLFYHLGGEARGLALVSATVLPIALAGPLFLYLSLKLRELAVVNHQLNDLASRDKLTGCFSRGAFTELVERHLEEELAGTGGALLVVDADHFKSINDSFGHDRGDEALALIAGAIRSVLRGNDAVGRLGGEEFGIHLPGANRAAMAAAAERVRSAVAATRFEPGGRRHRLSVSVGCAAYDGPSSFKTLFRIADQNLYSAKKQGRDRVQLDATPDLAPEIADLMQAS